MEIKPLIVVAILAFVAQITCQEYTFESTSPVRPAPHRIQQGFSGQVDTKPTPVPILKQINRHNEDGSYTYGYEGADGSFKIETKNPTGEVKGKYGYVDADGKLRVVEYGANKYGFQPAGEGITVAPPTLVDETTSKDNLLANPEQQYDDGQYYQPQPQPQPQRPIAPPRQTIAKVRTQPRPQYQDYSRPSGSPGPVPPRPLSIPGAVPSGVVYSEAPSAPRAPQHFFPAPQPTRGYTAPATPERFAPQFATARQQLTSPVQFEEPAPVQQQVDDYQYQSQPSPRPIARTSPTPAPQFFTQQRAAPAPLRPQSGSSVLDELAKEYALPAGGSPALHDITFGYF